MSFVMALKIQYCYSIPKLNKEIQPNSNENVSKPFGGRNWQTKTTLKKKLKFEVLISYTYSFYNRSCFNLFTLTYLTFMFT